MCVLIFSAFIVRSLWVIGGLQAADDDVAIQMQCNKIELNVFLSCLSSGLISLAHPVSSSLPPLCLGVFPPSPHLWGWNGPVASACRRYTQDPDVAARVPVVDR